MKYTPKLQVRGVENALPAAKKHFAEQIRLYGDNWMVNLVNQKGREQRVKEAYEEMVNLLHTSPAENVEGDSITSEKFHIIDPSNAQTIYDRLHYVYFDFHNETKGLRWDRAKLLMNQLEPHVLKHGYFCGVDMPGDTGGVEVRRHQTAVVRTNCMDCLDRTNVVQSMLGRYILSRMLIDLGLMREGDSAEEDKDFEHLFRNVWADNADVVSKSYSGTGALKTDFTRLGVRTKQGALQDLNNSVTRYCLNNFSDGPRQDAFDLFLGNYLPSDSGIGGQLLFADRRPLFIQSIPYILAASIFFILVGSLTRRAPEATIWPLRLLLLLSLVTAGVCFNFIWSNGTLYVSCYFATFKRKEHVLTTIRSTGPNSTANHLKSKPSRRHCPRSVTAVLLDRSWAQSMSEARVMRDYLAWRKGRRGSNRRCIHEVICFFALEFE